MKLKIFKIDLTHSKWRAQSGEFSKEEDINRFTSMIKVIDVKTTMNADTAIITVCYKDIER